MLTLGNLHGFWVSGAKQVSASFITYSTSGFISTTSHTFTGISLGLGGRVIVAISGGSAGNISGVTIDGVSATQRAHIYNGTALRFAAIYEATVTATSGNVVVTTSGSRFYSVMCAVYNVSEGSTQTSATSGPSSAPSATLNVPGDSAVIAVAACNSSPAASVTWTGATKDCDPVDGSLNYTRETSAHVNLTAPNASLTVTATFSAGSAVGAFAVFSP